VDFYGLNVAYDEPEPEGGDVAWHDGRAGEGGDAEDEHLGPMRVWCGVADGRRELVVDADTRWMVS
jgi:hypothetical protein